MKGFYPGFELKGKTETVVFWQVANLLLWFRAYPFCLSVRHVLIIASIGRDSVVSILLVCFVTVVCLSSFQAVVPWSNFAPSLICLIGTLSADPLAGGFHW